MPITENRMPRGLPLQVLPMFFFIHLPKTGGSSLNAALARMFSPFAEFHQTIAKNAGGDSKIQDLLSHNPDFYDDLLVVVGHYSFRHPLVQMTRRRRVILSVLREPVSRIVSLYDYIRHRPDHPLHVELSGMSFLEAIRGHEAFRSNCNNTQLRSVFGTPEAETARRLLRRRNYVLGRFDHLERFLGAVEAISGLKRTAPLEHRNPRPPHIGVQPAIEQPDYTQAFEEVSARNAEEIAFFSTMPPLIVTTAST